jgi:hypothetical protein
VYEYVFSGHRPVRVTVVRVWGTETVWLLKPLWVTRYEKLPELSVDAFLRPILSIALSGFAADFASRRPRCVLVVFGATLRLFRGLHGRENLYE